MKKIISTFMIILAGGFVLPSLTFACDYYSNCYYDDYYYGSNYSYVDFSIDYSYNNGYYNGNCGYSGCNNYRPTTRYQSNCGYSCNTNNYRNYGGYNDQVVCTNRACNQQRNARRNNSSANRCYYCGRNYNNNYNNSSYDYNYYEW